MRAPKSIFDSILSGIILTAVLILISACGREGTARPPEVPETVQPAAVAGPDQIVPVGQEVLLDGRGSTNPAGAQDLSYRWSLLDQPYFSGAFLLEWDQAVTYFIPDLPGRYYLELKVSDTWSDSTDVAIITAKVPRSGNRSPILTQFTPAADMISLSLGQEAIFSVSAEDPDGDEMVINWYVDEAFAGSGSDFIFTAGPEQVGRAVAVRVVVSDGDQAVSHEWVVTVNQAESGDNSPPVFNPVPDQTVSEDETLVFVVRAIDPDGDPVSYFASLLPAGAVFFKETGKFKWIPDYDQAGEYEVVFSASDGKSVSSVTVMIRVLNTNRVPTLEVSGSRTVFEGGELVLVLIGSDPDDDLLSFADNPPLRGAVLYPQGSTAAWIWHPDYDQAGSYREVFTVTDLSDPPLTASVAADIVVYNTNRPPVLTGLSDRVVSEGQVLDFWLTAGDPDGNNVTYTAGPLPWGSTVNGNTGEFFWVPDFNQAGDYALAVTATDDGDPRLSDTGTVMITVQNVNRPPAITAFSAIPSSLNTGGTVNFSVTAHDPDGDATIVRYDWDFDGNGAWVSTTAATVAHVYTLNGNYTARVRVVDDGGATAEATTPVRVKPGAADLLLSQVMKSGTAMGIFLEVVGGTPPAGYLYVADGEAGMEVFSVPNLNNPDPILWSRAGTSGNARSVFKYGSRAYLALNLPEGLGGQGARVIDVSERSGPADLGSIGNDSIVDVWVGSQNGSDRICALRSVEDYSYALLVFDALNYVQPYRRIYYNPDRTFSGRALAGDDRGYVYVGDIKNGLSIYNSGTSNCAYGGVNCYFDAVIAVAPAHTTTPVQDVKVKILSDNQRYLALARDATGKGEVKLYQTETYPLAPIEKGVIFTKNCGNSTCLPERIFLSSGPDRILVAIGTWGYQIIDASDPANLAMVIPGGGQDERFDPCSGCDYTYDLTAYGDYTYLADGAMGLVVTKNNLSTTHVPNMVTYYHPSGNPTDLQAKSGKLFVALGRGGMDVYDLSLAPDTPRLLGNVNTPGEARGVSADGTKYAYVADLDTASGVPPGTDRDGLRIIDYAANPVQPDLVDPGWTDPAINNVSRVFVSGNYAYLCADKLYIIDVTNKTSPVKTGDYSMISGSPRDVAVSGNYIYVINQDTLAVLDMSNSASPVLKDSETIVNGQAVAYGNGLVYVADGDSGLKIYDVTDPQNVALRGTYAGKAYDVDLWEDYAFVAADSSGMVMLDISNPASPVPQVSLPISAKVVNRVSVSYDANSHYYYVYTLNGTWKTGILTLDQFSVIRIR
ncbi:MAG: PKD domain-containing protein [bacterium]|nr:PKD domain-containing protein [bacterium]